MPFDFNVINPDRSVPGKDNVLLSCEKLTSTIKVRDILDQQAFTGLKLRAMADLAIVGAVYPSDSLRKVFYITHDNDGNLSTTLLSNQLSQIGTWKIQGIPLEVVTIGNCAPWHKAQVPCKPIAELETALQEFLLETIP